ncbi:hypothetical protein MUK42_27018 [Musa troglodytarum]|uniref:Large ribosomal subunit protein bL20c n=1 Tax=Musa troglodytarum TaxID=320322 RepID=A0A9E7FES5_9LILI|nr:hypothetical protein MUK42_27018 [Musa troglodytarum]
MVSLDWAVVPSSDKVLQSVVPPVPRNLGVNYGNFMHGLMKENIQLNRKVLSELSIHEPYSFKSLVDISRNAFPGNNLLVKDGSSIAV